MMVEFLFWIVYFGSEMIKLYLLYNEKKINGGYWWFFF